MNLENQIKQMNSNYLLNVLIHDRKMKSNVKKLIEKELKERKVLI
jgi:TusA-related sulfurtransferase